MRIWPAQQDRQLFVIVFISVMLILLIGSVFYKYGYTNVSEERNDIYQTIAEDIAPVESVTRPTVMLELQPTQKQPTDGVEYQLVLSGVDKPTLGIAIKIILTSITNEASLSEVSISENIGSGPWQVIINKAEVDTETNQPSLQFAATSTDLKTSIIGDKTVLGSFKVVGSVQPKFDIAEDSLLTTNDQAYDIVLSNN